MTDFDKLIECFELLKINFIIESDCCNHRLITKANDDSRGCIVYAFTENKEFMYADVRIEPCCHGFAIFSESKEWEHNK